MTPILTAVPFVRMLSPNDIASRGVIDARRPTRSGTLVRQRPTRFDEVARGVCDEHAASPDHVVQVASWSPGAPSRATRRRTRSTGSRRRPMRPARPRGRTRRAKSRVDRRGSSERPKHSAIVPKRWHCCDRHAVRRVRPAARDLPPRVDQQVVEVLAQHPALREPGRGER